MSTQPSCVQPLNDLCIYKNNMCNWSTWGFYSRVVVFIRVALTLLSSSMECCCVFFGVKNKLYLKLKRKEN